MVYVWQQTWKTFPTDRLSFIPILYATKEDKVEILNNFITIYTFIWCVSLIFIFNHKRKKKEGGDMEVFHHINNKWENLISIQPQNKINIFLYYIGWMGEQRFYLNYFVAFIHSFNSVAQRRNTKTKLKMQIMEENSIRFCRNLVGKVFLLDF